ncbi:hypothetical protein [Acinetobacter gerneri]|uniref:Uncharacterized protein n=1 Tax=Acinetobacter gerneri DSM 14967 = CIP 107464 = MTCC 9824 TaxID=1120926 RepID=N8ZG31_9GAMM|nr:hypothetical protein [Acinetobacter gerneri]ENV32714.1 hypothetical protein F960_03221 [Acinetobacter gerneri DSM 14967 = CIP 107464 = MTCC 9824]EPR80436.1 hypothetical protein L289_0618 [Acinetobacter gerneri DSM 14967 = CIP 107464 = MTCC 9824]
MNEILNIPFERPFEFSIIEFDKIYHVKNMAIFEIFKMDDPNELGVECAVYNNKEITDMTLEGRLFIANDKLCFMYILFKF